jgi:5-methylcytosine-specific restriction endonuclease McrA
MSRCPRTVVNGMRSSTDFLTWSERNEIKQSVMARDIHLCVWCQRAVGDHRAEYEASMDHVIPRAVGGAYEAENLVVACRPCNFARRDLSLVQFLVERASCA